MQPEETVTRVTGGRYCRVKARYRELDVRFRGRSFALMPGKD